jgi:hypothetical protein
LERLHPERVSHAEVADGTFAVVRRNPILAVAAEEPRRDTAPRELGIGEVPEHRVGSGRLERGTMV